MKTFDLRALVRITGIVLSCLLVVMGTFAKRGWLDWRRMVRENVELSVKLGSVRREKSELERRSEQLQNDRAEQERVIRSVLGYVRPDETVIEFP